MKYSIIIQLLLAMMLFNACGKQTGDLTEHTFTYPDGTLREKWNEDRAGLKHGKAYTYYRDGKTQTEAEFQNGYLHGMFVMWDTSGNTIAECEYRNGEPWTGTAVTFDALKQKVTFQEYREGKPVGK